MKIAAAVVTHNRLNDLKLCIQSLRAQTTPLSKLIVIDNGSTDDTAAWLNHQRDLYVIKQNNQGSAGGFYTAISAAGSLGLDLVYCVDDDCIVATDAITSLLRARSHVDNPRRWVLTSYVHDPVSKNYGPLADFLNVDFSKPPNRSFYTPREIPDSHVHYGIYLNWGHFFLGVLFPLQLLDTVGLPDKKFFIRGEDYEYLLRCMKLANVGCVLDSVVHHGMSGPGDDCVNGLLDWKGYCQMRNHLYINRKYYPSYRNCVPARLLKCALLCVEDVLRFRRLDKFKLFAFFDALAGRFDFHGIPVTNTSHK